MAQSSNPIAAIAGRLRACNRRGPGCRRGTHGRCRLAEVEPPREAHLETAHDLTGHCIAYRIGGVLKQSLDTRDFGADHPERFHAPPSYARRMDHHDASPESSA